MPNRICSVYQLSELFILYHCLLFLIDAVEVTFVCARSYACRTMPAVQRPKTWLVAALPN